VGDRTPPSTKKASHVTIPHAADPIIAELNKSHPMLEARNTPKVVEKPAPQPQRPVASTYRPNYGEAIRLKYRKEYLRWNTARLLKEAENRRLHYEHEDRTYLVDIMMINDDKFFASMRDLKHLNVTELLDEAEKYHLDIDRGEHPRHDPLLFDIASRMARNAVTSHNDRLKAEQVTRGREKSHRSNNPRMKKIREDLQRAEDEKKAKKQDRKLETSKNSRHSDSGYSTSTKPSASPSPHEDSDAEEGTLDRSKERTTTRRNSQQDEPVTTVKSEDEGQAKGKKRGSPDEGFSDEHSPKKAKSSPEDEVASRAKKAHRLRRSSQVSSDNGGDTEVSAISSPPESIHPETEAGGASALEEDVLADARIKQNKRKSRGSGDEEDSDESSSKKQKTDEKRKSHGAKAPAKKSLKTRASPVIVTEAEKVKGLSYTPLEGGKLQLRRSARN